MTTATPSQREAILARLVIQAPGQQLGRTAVMKLMYFLQELKGLPLGYDFRLYTYGPFDSEVLSDLATATTRSILHEATVLYARGYGYAITPDRRAAQLALELALSHAPLASAIDEVLAEFGQLGAAELELRSTILYVDREHAHQSRPATAQALAERVRQIKPHFPASAILAKVEEFGAKGWLQSIPDLTPQS